MANERGQPFEAVFEDGDEFVADFGEKTVFAGDYVFGDGLLYDEPTLTVSVDMAESVSAGDRRPVTSDAVSAEVGNIEVLLHTI